MSVAKLRIRAAAQIPTASMADIAFLLLIFFLVTTVFDEERGLPLVLPDAEVVDVPPANVLHLLIGADGGVDVRRGDAVHGEMVTAATVASIWRLEFARNENLIAGVKTHPDASYRNMIDVLDALQTAGATRISLQALGR